MNFGNLGNLDFSALAKGQQAWNTFKANHPNFPKFLKYVADRGVTEGTEVVITIKYPDGQNVNSSIKVKPDDVALFESLKGTFGKML
ncbi:MAG: hypothetical protein IJ133_00160 [Clostridia bacterium]|nr:hypothetical protein [Clostridia bacterium]